VSETQKPRPAATIILLRPTEANGFEVFLTRRPADMAFLGSIYCFPGGGVSRDDCTARMIARSCGMTPNQARKVAGAHLSPAQALGFWIAGVRELFEEIGVLLAVDHTGRRFPVSPAQSERLGEKHRALLQKSLTFPSLLEGEDLYCDLSRLAYLSHWQTPAETSVRFDTRFFLAALPAEQTPLSTSDEVTHSQWLAPDRALSLFERGELPLIFPTFASLRTLADFDTLESVFKEFGA
jgi:8-oxo-dGTP pyrophosphatase MutT (NUDIX family)